MTNEKHRQSIRLHRDYSTPGTYFVTICAHERHSVFGRITSAQLVPTELGRLARECWVVIPEHFAQVELHEFVIMPNHLHGLIAITRKSITTMAPATAEVSSVGTMPAHNTPPTLVGAQHCCALPPGGLCQAAVLPASLGAIIRSYKSIVARRAHKELSWNGPIWQRNYFERALRDGKEFADASRYIAQNPKKSQWNRENPECKTH